MRSALYTRTGTVGCWPSIFVKGMPTYRVLSGTAALGPIHPVRSSEQIVSRADPDSDREQSG